MTLEQILTFLQVARLGGVRRAAQQMHLSQPAISARISGLESDLGVALFSRGTKGVTLTKQGIILRGHAEQIAVALEHIKAEVVPAESKSSLLRIGAAETVVQTWFPEFLKKLSRTYPNLNIEISVDLSVNLREGLLERAYDLVILMGPVSEYSVDNFPLPPFRLAWYKPLDMVATGIGVGLMPEALGERLVKEGRIASFDPGWVPLNLEFTASFIAESKGTLPEVAAKIAQEAAFKFIESN